MKDQCFRVIRERANPEALREAKKANEEMMKYVYLIVEKSKNNNGAINISQIDIDKVLNPVKRELDTMKVNL